jgi:hypothetical protein
MVAAGRRGDHARLADRVLVLANPPMTADDSVGSFSETTMRHFDYLTKFLAACLLCLSGAAYAGGNAMQGLDANDRAKVMKEKSKRAALSKNEDKKANSAETAECGKQEVGNVNTGGGPAPRNVTVVTGDVFNFVDGKCK